MHPIDTICVCGAGTMGAGIAQVSAMSGIQTIQFDVNPAMLAKSRESIECSLEILLAKGRVNAAEKQAILARIHFTAEITDCVADLVIEAIIEKKEAKTELFTQLAGINKTETIFATNTSSISVNEIALLVPLPSRVIGLHFFNPAPVMKLVEIIRTEQTDDETVNSVIALSHKMGKTPVVCKDAPGFIVNRVARPYYLEAMKLVESGVATIENIDAIMESTGFKMGPFKLMDLIGMDINFSVSNIVWQALGNPERLKPSALQQEKVAANQLGRKTGQGFYKY